MSYLRPRLPRVRITAGVVLGLLLGMLGQLPHAHAERHPIHQGIVRDDPADFTPDVLDGHVNAFVRVGPTMIVGGSFSQVAQGGVTYSRRNIFAFDAATGAVSTTFRPAAFGEVFDLQVSANRRGVYVVGDFSSINHHAKTTRVARIKVSSGKVDRAFRSPGVDRAIRDIAYAHGRYYIAGDFTRIGGHARTYVAALNARGRDTNRAKVRFSGTNRNGRTHVTAMDVSAVGNTMVVVGNFMTVDGKRRPQVAVLALGEKRTRLASWATTRFAPRCGIHFDSYMRDVAISPDGSYFVIAATGGPKGVQSSGLLCDTVTRWNLGKGAGKQPAWVDYTGGDTLTAVIVDQHVVYVGGHQRWFNNSFGQNTAGPGAVERPGIGALDPLNGLPYSWNPGRPRGVGVSGFALTKGGLWVGHDTAAFGGEPHLRIAFCPIGTALPSYRTAKLPGILTLLGKGVSNTVVASDFDGVTSDGEHSLTSDKAWQDVRGTFVVDGTLYAGWADGTMTARSYDGDSFGPESSVDLHGSFSELATVRAMFFDRAAHRVYYTREGSSALFYRYFQPESQTVGSWRYKVKAKSKVAWDRVSGAFVVRDRLYYVDSPTATLRRVTWNASTHRTVGSPKVLLGPHHDHVSYRSRGLVLVD
jgi:hypothetical protein